MKSQLNIFPPKGRSDILVVAYGLGVDSTAMLIGMWRRGLRPDLILFADVGGEKEETYAYLAIVNSWLRSVGFPEVTVVRYVAQNFKHWPPYATLEENCLTNGTLPSISFGFSSCSQKWKAAPQHKYLKSWQPSVEAWSDGFSIRKAIGYGFSPRDLQRREKADNLCTYADAAEGYDYWYPLQEWQWDRERCKAEIESVGLPVPAKSSCFFCLSMKEEEVKSLPIDKLRRIVLLEARAKPRLQKVEGLWRKSTKRRPGSMTDYIRSEGLLPASEIDRIQMAPAALIKFQQEFRAGMSRENLNQFLEREFPEMYSRKTQLVSIMLS